MSDEARQLGRYELIKRIAVGGMGVIYLAKSRGAAGFEKTVIIKKILDHLAEEEEFVTKFCDEGRIVVNLTHGNIVPVFDMGEEDGEYFIAMDYVPGRDLREVLKRVHKRDERVPVPLAVHLVCEACKGLDYAHKKTDDAGRPLHIVHRDISPSNILISREGEVKVIDFGIARAASRAGKTATGRIQGKICYMSPEQAQGKSVDHRSDIFSMGVVLYEMLTGVRPFEATSDLQSLDLVRQCEFEAPSQLNPQIPAELDAIVAKALTRDRDQRYQSVDELHVELLEWLYSGGRAVTSQKLAEFVHEFFPEGYEREELRRARDASTTGRSGQPKMNLDDAMNAELDKLGFDKPAAGIDPLSTTATELGDNPATPTLNPTPATNSEDDSATEDEPAPEDESAPEDVEPVVQSASDDASEEGTADDLVEEGAADTTGDPQLSASAESKPEDDAPGGFKRWLAIAAAVGLIAGAVLLYVYAATEYGKVEVRTEPSGASIEVDGVRVSGAHTPEVLELETGERAITLLKDGYQPETFQVEVRRTKEFLLDDGTIELRPADADDGVRKVWVVADPDDATLRINGADTTHTGKTTVTVAPDESVLVEAEHPDCEKLVEFITHEQATAGQKLELDCKPAPSAKQAAKDADAGPDAAGSAAVAHEDGAGDDNADQNSGSQRPPASTRTMRFASEPEGADIVVDDTPVEPGRPHPVRVGRKVHLEASLQGYETVDRRLRVSHNLPNRYTIELQKLPTGCVIVRPPVGQQAEVTVDGTSYGETNGKRLELPVGEHEIVLTYADETKRTYPVDVRQGVSDCPVVGFEEVEKN
ncbi:MAG: protein kinase domain-containing protein [Persicimonas sp.]